MAWQLRPGIVSCTKCSSSQQITSEVSSNAVQFLILTPVRLKHGKHNDARAAITGSHAVPRSCTHSNLQQPPGHGAASPRRAANHERW